MEAVKMMLEFIERSKVKRLTLTLHYDPRVEEFVVNEMLAVFKQAEDEEEIKAEEEAKQRQKEEEKKKQEKDTSNVMVIETS
ncbi:hypothetical protein A2U01_0078250, partial [Trifolium medium]|nr:hypothetical protein [Trifolium medium]